MQLRAMLEIACTSGLILSLAGCSSSDSKLVRVEGILTLDSQPLNGALVSLFPEEGKSEICPGGMVNEGGRFSLSTNGMPGVLPGKYKVTVTMITMRLPMVYADASRSPLKAEIPPDGKTDLILALDSKIKVNQK